MPKSSREDDAMDLFAWADARMPQTPASADVVEFLVWRATSERFIGVIAPRARDIMAIATAIDRRTGRLPTPPLAHLPEPALRRA